jgi:hypothetical protein
MGSQVLLQVASTFDASPLGASLGSVLVEAEGVTFVQYTQISEYLLSPAANSAQSLGSLIILRVEDWLREELQSIHRDSFSDSWIRQQLRIRTDEFVSQLTTLSDSGKQVWFFACPSTGWIAEQHKLTTLFRTYTNLIATRVRNLSHVTSLAWPVSLSVGEIDDHLSDRLEHIPFTPSAFDLLGRYAGIQVVRTLIRRDLKIKLAEALPDDRVHVDRLLRGTASFSLTGERPSIEDSEVSALLDSHTCRLVHVCDRVGDYGASGLVLFHVTEDGMSVSSLALSCTVLGKQVEFAVLSVLAQLAVDNGLTKLVFEYTPTSRNQAILKFLQLIADRESNTRYVVPIDKIESRIKASAINSEAWTIEQSVGQEDGLLLR